ncbi:MAG: altronate dehydratase family protein [Erysipelotrichaceae bacterium]
MTHTLKLNEKDNVAVALSDCIKGSIEQGIVLLEDIKQGHKFALGDIKAGEPVVKYGNPIGNATAFITTGSHVHTHNTTTSLQDHVKYEYRKEKTDSDIRKPLTFEGYPRFDGQIGIRNELWIIVLVGCVNAIADAILRRFNKQHPVLEIDGAFTFAHPYGCSQMGDDHELTKQILQNMVHHPNAGGILILGLGCENNQLSAFMDSLGEVDNTRIRTLVSQEVDDEIKVGAELLDELYDVMKNDRRATVSAEHLVIGLKCGGSDGLSGITANPLVGKISDYFISIGASALLTEVPEMFGAEQILMNRAKNPEVYRKTVTMIDDFKQYYIDNNQVVYENPSPGNKAGGITTLEDKSLGCIQKAGHSEVADVLTYGDRIKEKGLTLISGPGNDIVATTLLGSAGAQLVLFTTGRGTPFGGFIPTLKISSNSEIALRKPHWIDYDAGCLITGTTMDEATNQLVSQILRVASGDPVNNETNGNREIAIFKMGVTL